MESPAVKKLFATTSIKDLPEGFVNVIASRVDDLLTNATQRPLEQFEEQISLSISNLFRSAPDNLRLDIQSKSAESSIYQGYLLGQLSFAQLLVSQAARKRVDDEFLQAFDNSQYEQYLASLFDGELSGVELASAVHEAVETVSRKLSKLRDLGIVECRRDGTRLKNFLSPAAREVLSEKIEASVKLRPEPRISEHLSKYKQNLPSQFSSAPYFCSPAERRAAA